MAVKPHLSVAWTSSANSAEFVLARCLSDCDARASYLLEHEPKASATSFDKSIFCLVLRHDNSAETAVSGELFAALDYSVFMTLIYPFSDDRSPHRITFYFLPFGIGQ